MSCQPLDLVCAGGEALSQVTSDALAQAAQTTAEAFGNLMGSLGTFWLDMPTPDIAVESTGAASGVVALIQGNLIYYVAVIAMVSIIIGAIRIVLSGRGNDAKQIVRGIVTLVLVNGAGIPVLAILISVSDSFAVWIVDQASDGTEFSANLGMVTAMTALVGGTGGAILVLILGVVAILMSVGQLILMMFRSVLIVLLASMLTFAASAAATEMGMATLKKYATWLIAVVLYKPVAGIVYAIAFVLIGSGPFSFDDSSNLAVSADGENIKNIVAGLVLMLVALAALPALMTLITPAVGALGSGSAGGAAAAGVGTMASGAVSVANMKQASAGAAPGAASSSAGSTTAAGSAAAAGGGAAAAGGGAAAAGGGAAAAGGGAAAGGAAAGAAGGAAGGPAGMAIGAAAVGAAAAAGGAAKSGVTSAVEGSGKADGS